MTLEEASDIRRGRPRVFSDDALRQAARFSYARRVKTRRGAQDLVYRQFAVAALELYCEAFPDNAHELQWFLVPDLRHSLLSELGRIGEPRSDENGGLRYSAEDVNRLIRVAAEIARVKPTTKAGVAMIRELRRGFREITADSSLGYTQSGVRVPAPGA